MIASKNDKGEYATYDLGKFIGYREMVYINGKLVLKDLAPVIIRMQEDALKVGITLRVNSGFRANAEQLALRKQNVIDKSKVDDMNYLLTQHSTKFNPPTAIPGWSNHQDGSAIDFQTKDILGTVANEAAYSWLVKNAIGYGFVRAVASERWHWEYKPGAAQFSIVPKTHESWDGLV